MAEKYDAASRLAEGTPSVDDIENYVSACQAIGYQHPDLTLHAAQVRDWYASEDGMDLRALDADCAALQAVVAATEDALARQADQLSVMSGAWQGRGADASREFLRRHGEASALAAAAIRTAANALADLRDSLWRTVDSKVATVLAIDDRVQARRADWLAAAQTVSTGAGDRSVASELVDQEIKPFIDSAIRAEWVSAMRAAMAAVTAAYDAATTEIRSEGTAVFDVPGDLGPSWTPQPRDDDAATTPAAAPAPVGSAPSWSAPAPWTPPAAAAATPPSPLPTPAPSAPLAEPAAAAPAAATPPIPSPGGMGGGMPDIGSGLSGFGQQLADTLGGLFGSADDALQDPGELEKPDPLDEEPESESDDDLEEDELDEDAEEAVDPAAESDDICEKPSEEPPTEPPPVEPPPVEPAPVEPPPPPGPAPTPAPLPPPEPAPPPEPMAATATPCEIAADALPQVGS